MSNNDTLQRVAGISFRRACLNVESVWRNCTPGDIEAGARWYEQASQTVDDIAALSGDSRETVAAVVAQLSPRTTWDRNKAGAHAACVHGTQAPGIMAGNYGRAQHALETGRAGGDAVATVRGPKTRSFALNCLGDRTAVTVDIWAARIALDPDWRRGDAGDIEHMLERAGAYVALANAYRVTAARLGIDAATLQASTWVHARNGRAG